MAFKYLAVFTLISLAAVVMGVPQFHHGHDLDGGHAAFSFEHGGHVEHVEHAAHGLHGGHGHESGLSHQSVHLVSHDDGHHGDHDDHHGHGHAFEHSAHSDHDDHHDSNAEYDFNYGVKDKKTGDIKEHSESRHGHKVSGKYELIDSDGHKRTVVYTADKHTGFHATVHRDPTHIKIPEHQHHDAHEHDHGHVGAHDGGAIFEESHDDGHGHGHDHGVSSHKYSLVQVHGSKGHDHGFH